jgi:hypothetical protein
MTEDVRRKMTEEELRRALADMRSIAQAEKEFTRTNVRQVDVSSRRGGQDGLRLAREALAHVSGLQR